jgi:hypothetical protein
MTLSIMLSVIVLSVIVPSVVVLSVILLNVLMLSVIALTIIVLRDTVLSVIVLSDLVPSDILLGVIVLAVLMLNVVVSICQFFPTFQDAVLTPRSSVLISRPGKSESNNSLMLHLHYGKIGAKLVGFKKPNNFFLTFKTH